MSLDLSAFIENNNKNVTPEELNSPPRGTVDVDIEKIKNDIMKELVEYATTLGERNYILAKVIHEKTKNLTIADTHKIYTFICEFLGISIKTIKNLVWVYKRLEKYTVWHNESGLFKLRLFQLAYYVSKHCSDVEVVFDKLYLDMINDIKLRVWFGKAGFKEILTWFKEKYGTYIKTFAKDNTYIASCDICGTNLTYEEYNKTWGYLPVCFTCYEYLKQENKQKIHMLKNTIAKKLKEAKVYELQNTINQLKKQLLERIEEFDKLRLQKSKKYKKLQEKINKSI